MKQIKLPSKKQIRKEAERIYQLHHSQSNFITGADFVIDYIMGKYAKRIK